MICLYIGTFILSFVYNLLISSKLFSTGNAEIISFNICKLFIIPPISDLETIITVIESSKFDIDEIRNSLQMLKEIISAFPVENNLEEISKLKTKDKMKVPIYKQINRLKEFINKHAENMFKRFS